MSGTLLQAYLAATYEIWMPQGVEYIVIEDSHPWIDHWMRPHRYWSLITAYNPHSLELSPLQNLLRQQSLIAQVINMGIPYRYGRNRSSDHLWIEDSLLLCADDYLSMTELAKKYDQTAIVIGKSGNPATLKLLTT